MKPHPHWIVRARIAHDRLADDADADDAPEN